MPNKGFTLIELSIVLVIIGLLVGGILAGNALILAAEIRAAVSQKERFDRAAVTFKLKYNCLPGDCYNATSIGFAEGGNGNGLIGWDGTTNHRQEIINLWQHLGAAKLIEGEYAAFGTTGTKNPSLAVRSSGDALWSIHCDENYFGGAAPTLYSDWRANSFLISRYVIPADGDRYSTLKPAIAHTFDAKIDDGYPLTGSVRAYGGDFVALVADECQPIAATGFVDGGGVTSNQCMSNATTPIQYNLVGNLHTCDLVISSSF